MFNVGDKVYLNDGVYIGTVIRITEKRQDVVVDFGKFCGKFHQNGRSLNGDGWRRDWIHPLTEEMKEKIMDDRTVRKCKKMLSDIGHYNLTPDKARKIIAFFEQEIFK